MKKLTFLLGSLGGALAGYVFSNPKLRNELMKSKDATAAAHILGKHLSADGQTVAKEVKQLAEQHHLDDKISDGKKYVHQYYMNAKDEVQKFVSLQLKEAKKTVGKTQKKVVKKEKSLSK